MSYPVRVVIPTVDSRRDFLVQRCLPSVRAADPEEIMIVAGGGNGNHKRNLGATGTKQPFLLFVDDDCEIRQDCLKVMVEAMRLHPTAAFVYSDFRIEIAKGVPWSGPSGDFYPGKFDSHRLRLRNYINTTSLIRTEAFPGFDPCIRRLQDWDLWLTMAARGSFGVYVNENLFTLNQIDSSISIKESFDDAVEMIRKKHGISADLG